MRKALVVGINDYPNAPLRGCVNDANAITNILGTHGDGSPNFGIRIITSPSETVTRPKLKSEIEALFSSDSEIALLYFSGHGIVNSLGGYIVTTDFKKYDEGVSMDDILKYANQSKAKDKIIILDCCHSGAFGSLAIAGSNVAQLSEGLSVLTASRDSESALEINGCGVFTALVVNALQGGAADLRGHIGGTDREDSRPTKGAAWFRANSVILSKVKTTKRTQFEKCQSPDKNWRFLQFRLF